MTPRKHTSTITYYMTAEEATTMADGLAHACLHASVIAAKSKKEET